MTKFVFKSILGLFLILTSFSAQAYDKDTHFYGTYSMARFAGIKHEIALKIATGSVWMDESYISDPLTMILLPDVGIKKRRLLHFPGSRLASKMTQNTLPLLTDPSSGTKLKTFTETEADHEFASELFTEGLMEGNLMKASAGLHTLQDSFAHAGTIAELGHAHFWHHPDRPYVDDQSVEKYFKMARSVFKALVAMRALLPLQSLDTSVKFSDTANYNLDGDTLADLYEKNEDVRKVISHKMLNDEKFVQFALDHVFRRAEEAKYITPGYKNYLKVEKNQDTYQAASSIAKELPQELINLEDIMKHDGRPGVLTAEYLLSMGGIAKFVEKVIHDLLTGIVPRPIDAYHRFEKEEDGPIWMKEMDLRIANMRSLIYKLYGADIYFIKNNTHDANGYLRELTLHPEAQPALPQPNGSTEYVTYSLQEKSRFNNMIFSFLFPKLSAYLQNDPGKVSKVASLIIETQSLANTNVPLADRVQSQFNALYNAITGSDLILSSPTIFELARKDVTTSRLVPSQYNRYFTVPTLVQRQIKKDVFKKFKTE